MWYWLTGIPVRIRLVMLCGAFVLPIAVLFFLLFRETNKSIDFARLEKDGNAYLRPLENLLDLLARHQLATQPASQSGNAEAAKLAVVDLERQTDAAFQELAAVDARLGNELGFTEAGLKKRHRENSRPEILQQEWDDLKRDQAGLSPSASDLRHLKLLTGIRTMITHVGDTSKLILDPDLDSYYLIDVTLLSLPHAQNSLAEILSLGSGILHRKSITPTEKLQLETDIALLMQVGADRVEASTLTSLTEDSNCNGISKSLQQNLPRGLQSYRAAVDPFVQMLQRIASGATGDLSEGKFLAAGTQASSAAFEYWKVADQELDTLLNLRIASLESAFSVSVVWAGLALLVTLAFVLLVMRSINQPLRARVVAVENELHHSEADLVDRNKALSANNQALEAFSYSVAHDLQAPLRRIDGFAEMLGEQAGTNLDEECRAYLATISRSTKELSELIKALLAFSRIGQAPLEKVQVESSGMVQEVTQSCAPNSSSAAIEWNIQPLPAVNADPRLLKQVWANLIQNALKYSRTRPQRKIEIGATVETAEVTFFVRDNGVGFDPNYAHKLFGVFQRLHSAKEFEGTGIGLANVHRIIERHGGRVWANGILNEGATFYFTLPATPSA